MSSRGPSPYTGYARLRSPQGAYDVSGTSLSLIDVCATVREMTGHVVVIGAGPGGLIAARWLLSQGFEPTIFEQTHSLGGQWTGLAGISGVWPTMHTNTSRILTSFSDLEHDNDLTFPSNQDMLAYLRRYADTFALTSRIRFGTRVDRLSRGDGDWLVEHSGRTEAFERVVVASGRFHTLCAN